MRLYFVLREYVNEEGLYQLNSRVIGSLVIPQSGNQRLDVRVTLQHVKVLTVLSESNLRL